MKEELLMGLDVIYFAVWAILIVISIGVIFDKNEME